MDHHTDSVAVRSKLINKAIQDIGMGKYNWQLFILCGFGWFADKYVVSSPMERIIVDIVANTLSSVAFGCK